MIEMTYKPVSIDTGSLQKILHSQSIIEALAVQIVGDQVEYHLDMIKDAGVKEYSTFAAVDQCLQGAKESVEDQLRDLLADFRDSLLDAIQAVKVETQEFIQIPSTEDGITIDAKVNISIK